MHLSINDIGHTEVKGVRQPLASQLVGCLLAETTVLDNIAVSQNGTVTETMARAFVSVSIFQPSFFTTCATKFEKTSGQAWPVVSRFLGPHQRAPARI